MFASAVIVRKFATTFCPKWPLAPVIKYFMLIFLSVFIAD